MILGYLHIRRPLFLGCDGITGAMICYAMLNSEPGLSKMRQASSCKPFFAANTSAVQTANGLHSLSPEHQAAKRGSKCLGCMLLTQ